jgi:hypothetical protein
MCAVVESSQVYSQLQYILFNFKCVYVIASLIVWVGGLDQHSSEFSKILCFPMPFYKTILKKTIAEILRNILQLEHQILLIYSIPVINQYLYDMMIHCVGHRS